MAWPKDAADVREFVGSHFRSLFYANPTGMDPHENDVYELTAHDLLSAFRWWADLHPSPPEGMVGGWIASKDQMPPPGVRVFWGDVDSNRVGYDSWAGDDYRWVPSHWMHIPEFPAPPTSSADSRKGE